MEYWNTLLTEKSWEILQKLKRQYDFILIGGWATYLYAKQQKSKDIDMVVDIKELQKLKQENLMKNQHLKKYEIKREEIDVDIYVEYFSKLAIPVEDIKNYTTKIEGFTVVMPEILLILKQGAELDRGDSIKGEKDKIDILSLLFYTDIDTKKYSSIIKKYSLKEYKERLLNILKISKDYNALNMTPREFRLKKEKLLKNLKN
jgi:hypothetical protein